MKKSELPDMAQVHLNRIDKGGGDAMRSTVSLDDGSAAPSRATVLVLCCLGFVAGYLFSLWLLDLYRNGDQEQYANFWQAMLWAPSSLWSQLQLQYLSSSEPLYRYVIGFGAYNNFDRISYISVWNGILVSVLTFALVKHRASLIFSLLLFTNYYIFVLLGPAERLKFSYILLFAAFCAKRMEFKGGFAIAAVFAHMQAIAQFVSAAIYYFMTHRRKILSSRLRVVALSIGGPLVLALATYAVISSLGNIISEKAEYYGGQSQGIYEAIQWMMILISGLVIFNNKINFLLAMLPMGLLTALYGDRINIATLAFFGALTLTQRKTNHPLVLAVMGYMSFKTIGFMLNVLNTGQGFA